MENLTFVVSQLISVAAEYHVQINVVGQRLMQHHVYNERLDKNSILYTGIITRANIAHLRLYGEPLPYNLGVSPSSFTHSKRYSKDDQFFQQIIVASQSPIATDEDLIAFSEIEKKLKLPKDKERFIKLLKNQFSLECKPLYEKFILKRNPAIGQEYLAIDVTARDTKLIAIPCNTPTPYEHIRKLPLSLEFFGPGMSDEKVARRYLLQHSQLIMKSYIPRYIYGHWRYIELPEFVKQMTFKHFHPVGNELWPPRRVRIEQLIAWLVELPLFGSMPERELMSNLPLACHLRGEGAVYAMHIYQNELHHPRAHLAESSTVSKFLEPKYGNQPFLLFPFRNNAQTRSLLNNFQKNHGDVAELLLKETKAKLELRIPVKKFPELVGRMFSGYDMPHLHPKPVDDEKSEYGEHPGC